MDALAAYGSSDSDATSDEDAQPQASTKKEQGSKFQGDHDSNSERKAPVGPHKRKRVEGEGDQASSAKPSAHFVPRPPVSNGDSMIQWNKDYLASAQSFTSSSPKHIASEKLEQIRSKLPTNTSWASQLKSQHDFHNPNLFEGVVKLFDIQQPLGSNMNKYKEGLQDWESDVIAMEEKARILQQQSQSQASIEPSQFAQQQLAQAMQQQLR